jgi:RNA polymerase sigma factor for flagellar operon FliA
VLDWMREQSPGSRGLVEYERNRDALQGALGREPAAEEIGEALELSAAQVRRRERERVAARSAVSLQEAAPGDSSDGGGVVSREALLVATDRRDDPEAAMALRDRTRVVRQAVLGLPNNERVALIAPELDDAPLRRVGEELGVSASRVSQLRSKAIARLHDELEAHEELLAA